MDNNTLTVGDTKPLRRDLWRLEPLTVFFVLGSSIVYTVWAALQNAHYYAAPYLSPFYSPCISANCEHVSVPLIGLGWNFSPAFLILWIPGGFRITCYYHCKGYYWPFAGLPAGGAASGTFKSYQGETRLPAILQRTHQYFFWLSIPVLAFLWGYAIFAFRFPDGLGAGIGTLVLLINATFLSLYAFSCRRLRVAPHGFYNSQPRQGFWNSVSRLNERHVLFAWVSLIWVVLSDLYIRLVSMGIISDLRFF
ncbi:MAG: succinate dehydrogenase [Candidatus Binatia bacterium]